MNKVVGPYNCLPIVYLIPVRISVEDITFYSTFQQSKGIRVLWSSFRACHMEKGGGVDITKLRYVIWVWPLNNNPTSETL